MLETSARLLRLLSLLQAQRFWTGEALATRLEVSTRTVRRDVDRLRSLGYLIDATAGVAGGYRLAAGSALPPLLFDDDEALAVAVGLRTAVGAVSGLEEPAIRALVKLEQVMPARLERRLRGFHESVVPLAMPGTPAKVEILKALAEASRARETVAFLYEDAGGRASDRQVEPYGLVHSGPRWYLVAWDIGRGDFRSFRVDRIVRTPTPGAPFSPRRLPDKDLASYVSRSLSTRAHPYQLRVVLHAPLEEAARRVHPMVGRLERIDDERCQLEAGAHSLDLLVLHIAAIGFDFEVDGSPEIDETLRTLARRLRRASRRGPGKQK